MTSPDEMRGSERRVALVGATGFLGGTLMGQRAFTHTYSSKDIDTIRGEAFDLLVCAAPAGTKWKANRRPDADRASVDRLISCLSEVTADRVVHCSTIDVYVAPHGVDEASPIDPEALSPYGRNRFRMESFMRARFQATVLRLPALFGEGLRKNVILDLIEGRLEFVHPEARQQFYNLARLWTHARLALDEGLACLNLSTPPLRVGALAQEFLGLKIEPCADVVAPRYDMRTRHSALFGRVDGYIQSEADERRELGAFFAAERARRGR